MIDEKEFKEWKRKRDNLKESTSRAEGALQQLKEQLNLLGCSSVEEAEKLKKEKKKRRKELEEEYASLREDFLANEGKHLE